jgi:hypothetical protein
MLKDAAAARHQLRGPLCVPGFWVDFCMPSKTIRRSCEVRNMQWPRQDALIRSHASAQINSEMLRCRCSDQCVCVRVCVGVGVCSVRGYVCVCLCLGVFIVCVCACVCKYSDQCKCPNPCSDQCSDPCTDVEIRAKMQRSVCVGLTVSQDTHTHPHPQHASTPTNTQTHPRTLIGASVR